MVDCKSVLMELNFKKLSGSAAGPVLENLTECRQLVGGPDVLREHPSGHMLCSENFESTHG